MKSYKKTAAVVIMLIAVMIFCESGALAVNVTDLGGRLYTSTAYGTLAGSVIQNTAGGAAPEDFTANDYKSLVKTVEQQYVLRNPYFTVRYNTSRDGLDVINDGFINDVLSYDDPNTTSDMDYLRWNMLKMSETESMVTSARSSYAIITFAQSYRTTADQETYVNTSVDAALKTLNVGNAGACAKISAVHGYILKNVDYDDTLTKFTAYDALSSGKAVCQGYALLTYKMLTEIGVPARLIVGTTTQGPEGHAWNIAKVGRYWYNIDTTWDDQTAQTRYFLRNNTAFTDHIRESEYSSAVFNASYPMSPSDYDPSLQVQSVAFQQSGGTYGVGTVFALQATVTPSSAADKSLGWSSSDNTVASVDDSGNVRVNTPGTAVITVSASDGSGAVATFSVTAQTADKPSLWAQTGINALSARGVIPAALTREYQSSITRDEFTALIVSVYEYAKGSFLLKTAPPFTDISASSYTVQISKGYSLGIISGTSATTFSPDGSLTREQCAKIIVAAAGAVNGTPVSSTALLPFGDTEKIDGWALGSVRYAFENGLMTGSNTNFNPQGVLTREQAMLIAERLIEKYKA